MICVPIKKKKAEEIVENLKKAQEVANIIEIYFDELGADLNKENLKKIFATKKKPFIYKSEAKMANIEKVLRNKVEYIDIDLSASKSLFKKIMEIAPEIKIIISFHDFQKTPKTTELAKIAREMTAKGVDIIKIATMAESFQDSLGMLSFLNQLSKEQKTICICMGKEGKLTRLTGHLLGNYLMYAPINASDKTADGQITVAELKSLWV